MESRPRQTQMESSGRPLVSIGVPVFNGESGLGRCLEALLHQDYPNLEIIVSDNASTDATCSIAEHYARIDGRVKFLRSDQNRGGGWNFNRVFELSSGKYFMWAAHDDARAPSFVSACVERMEECPDAVLCQAHTAASIEGNDDTLYIARFDTFEHATGVVERYRETLKHFPATGMYGLYRSSAMGATMLFARVIATDMAFIQELSIHGRFIQVPETLFYYSARASWNTIQQDARQVLGHEKPWWYVPFVVLFFHHAQRIARSAIPFELKLRLWTVLTLHEIPRLATKVVLKLAGAVCPDWNKEKWGRALYWKLMHNPNLEVVSADPFFERVCKPQIGWWR